MAQLASPAQQRLLQLGGAADKDARALRDNLSGLAGRESWLYLAGDEGRSLLRLRREGDRREGEQAYGHPSWLKLRDFGLAGSKHDGESDLEGLALDGERLWLVGSHSLRRFKHTSTDDPPLALESRRSANGQVLGCLHLDGDGQARSGQRLRFHEQHGEDALTAALAAEPLLQPFLAIPSKDNGLDIEGIAARGERLLLGLRGPVLRGIALVAELQLSGLDPAPGSGPIGAPLELVSLHLRYLDLGGLAVRDLVALPGSNDALILAGPTMTLAGPCLLLHWPGAFAPATASASNSASIVVETVKPLLRIRSGNPDAGFDKPEGLHLQRQGEAWIAWVAYDNPSPERCRGEGYCTRLDGWLLP